MILYTMEGCAPCDLALHELKKLAVELGELRVVIRDVDTHPEAERLNLRSVPVTCVGMPGEKTSLKMDCVIGYDHKHYLNDIRKRLKR